MKTKKYYKIKNCFAYFKEWVISLMVRDECLLIGNS